jgi:hypothetical protein
VFVDWDCLYGLPLHVHIPDLDGEVVARENVAAIVGEANVGDRGDDFGEERAGGGIFFLFEFWLKSVDNS